MSSAHASHCHMNLPPVARLRHVAALLRDIAEAVYDWLFLLGYPDLWTWNPLETHRGASKEPAQGPRSASASSPLAMIRGEALANGRLRALRGPGGSQAL